MEYRIEHDSMGEVKVPADKYWAAQTERSHENFLIGVGIETMPREITHAFGILKKAAAMANHKLRPERMTEEKLSAISTACDEVISGSLNEHFPLVVWQTGSGTQSNMNANEVIANRGNEVAGKKILHPNDDVNMSQSSNDTFPTAMHISAVLAVEDKVLPAIDELVSTFRRLEEEHKGIVKSGRTHLQDATPIQFSQEISGWRTSLERDREMLVSALPYLKTLALGGTAVGTALNANPAYVEALAPELAKITGLPLVKADDLVDGTQNLDAYAYVSASLKTCAISCSKMANDFRLMSSGPRCGFQEINLPAKQNGSSIMPGKVNPVIPEVMSQAAFCIMGNDVCITMAAEAGQLELNYAEPVLYHKLFESINALAGAVETFVDNCVSGITANAERCQALVDGSVGIITAICPQVGYQFAADIAKKAIKTGQSVRELLHESGKFTDEEINKILDPHSMV